MATYLGFYTIDAGFQAESNDTARSGNTGVDPTFLDKVQGLTGALPEGTSIVGSYGTLSTDRPNVMIVDASDPSGLTFLNSYYAGYLEFDWTPATVVGGSQGERDAWRESVNG